MHKHSITTIRKELVGKLNIKEDYHGQQKQRPRNSDIHPTGGWRSPFSLHLRRRNTMDLYAITILLSLRLLVVQDVVKYICKDCAEAYTVTSGEYANKCLCFDCCEQLVAENVAELTKNKNKIKGQFILQLIGMVIGFIYGMSAGISSGDIGGGFWLVYFVLASAVYSLVH